MKRITIVSVFSLILAAASMGCSAQAGPEGDESDPNPGRSHMVAIDSDGRAITTLPPSQTLELNLHLNDDSQGPHPEPWLDRFGPHPEPWQGKKLAKAPDPDSADEPQKP